MTFDEKIKEITTKYDVLLYIDCMSYVRITTPTTVFYVNK